MRRSNLVCKLFLPFTLSVVACLFTQQLAFGQKGSNAPGSGMGVGGMGSGSMGSDGMGSGMAMGGRGSMSGPVMGMGSGTAQTNAEKEAAAFRDRCLLLTTKFVHNGVEFQSKTGIGCVIATPQGQRILAMPLSLIEPIEIDQERANKKLAIPSSLLLAAKIGSDRKCRERLDAFALQVADMPPSIETTDFAFESERRIFRALSARTEIAFSRTPLSNVMKFFQETFGIPIVIDERLLEMDALITLELPEVTFRSALNLILDPLDLTYVIENEVLKITTKQAAGNSGVENNASSPASENRIYRALNERQEVAFNGTSISGAMKFFREVHQIPIVIDERALRTANLTIDEPITLELPEVSFRSALNLMLDPLKLNYVVEDEVLKITTKSTAARVPRRVPNSWDSSFSGSVASSYSGGAKQSGMGGGVGGVDWFGKTPVHRYKTFLEAQRANQHASAQIGGLGGMGGSEMGGYGEMGGGGMGMGIGMGGARREYAAIHGPLAVYEETDLGVAFVSLPGDFLSIPIPTRVDSGRVQSVMLDDWQTTVELSANHPSFWMEGSPVVGETGKPVGLFIREKVVSFPQLFEALMRVDTKSLGYWGAESAKIEPQVVEGLPELIPAELKVQIENAAKLQGKEKDKAMKDLKSQLSTQVSDRNRFAERKIEAMQTKLAALTRLTNEMKKKDTEEVNKLLPKELALEIYEQAEDDPFK